MYSSFSMHSLRAIGRGHTIERSFCLGMTLWLAACTADRPPSKSASASRDPQTASGAPAALDDFQDSGMATRGAGMPIVPIHRADAGAKRDASIPVGNAPPVPGNRDDAGVDAGAVPPAPQVDAATVPAADAGSTLPPGAALPLPQPIRRYSFSGADSTLVPDAAGGSDALLRGNVMLDGAGAVSLPGQGEGFVELPSDLLGESTSFTVLVWLSVRSDACWQRALDLMHSQPSNAGALSTSLFLTPYGCPDGLPALGYIAGNARFHLYAESAIAGDELIQLGASFSARSQTLRLIVNGVVQEEQTVPVDVRTLHRARGVIGRSDFGDPPLDGAITELRVYASRLEPEELAEVYARGPDSL
jgi:hypothetical protein